MKLVAAEAYGGPDGEDGDQEVGQSHGGHGVCLVLPAPCLGLAGIPGSSPRVLSWPSSVPLRTF